MITRYNQQERIEKIRSLSYDNAERLLYMWIKQGTITLKQYRELNEVNNIYQYGRA